MYSETRFRKSALRSAIVLALSINGAALTLSDGAQAAKSVCVTSAYSTDSANFTMLTLAGYNMGPDGGTNDVTMAWDGTVYDSDSHYTGPDLAAGVANVTMSSSDPFFGASWVAHDVQVFLPGTYSFDTTLGGGNGEAGIMTVTVGPGQLGMHMLFDWSGNNNIDVFVVVNPNSAFGPGIGRSTTATASAGNNCDNTGTVGIKNCLFDGKPFGASLGGVKPLGSKVWMLASADGDGDGLMGIPMSAGGPFGGFKANFNFPGTFTNTTGTCSTFVDITPDPFAFTAVANAAFSTQYESNTITVTGLGAGQTPAVTITNGEYSKNGGAYTNAAGTATENDTFKVRGTSPGANGQTTSVTLNIGNGSSLFSIATPAIVGAQGSNFTMIDVPGGVTGGTNDVVANWDGTYDTNVSSIPSNRMTLSSITPFFQYNWTAHHIRVFGPGTYTIDTTCTVAQLEAGTSTCDNPLQTNPPQTQKYYTFTVGAGQIGAHMLFDWNNATNIDVVEVWNQNAVFGPSSMYTGSGSCNSPLTVWNLMSSDWDGDGKSGGAMVDGAFVGFSANFNIRTMGTPLTCSAYTPTVNVGEPTGTAGGGCSISPAPGKALARGDWWLVAGFLTWLGAFRMRFKRQAQS